MYGYTKFVMGGHIVHVPVRCPLPSWLDGQKASSHMSDFLFFKVACSLRRILSDQFYITNLTIYELYKHISVEIFIFNTKLGLPVR